MRYLLLSLLMLCFVTLHAQEVDVLNYKLPACQRLQSVSDCFEHIRQAGIVLSFNPGEIALEQETDIPENSIMTVQELLNKILDKKRYEFKTVTPQRKILIIRKSLKFTLSGYISEAGSNEYLTGATIYIPNSEQGCISNLYGFYSITLPEGKHSIYVSYIGYTPRQLEVDMQSNQSLDISLVPSTTQLSAVEITASSQSNNTDYTNINLSDNGNQPQLFGTNDIIKQIQFLTGAGGGLSGTGQLKVRGGKADNNLILLDEVPLYNYNHFTGLLSIFNSDALKNVKFYKGQFPARYGGRLSSVADIRMREGDMNSFHTGVSLDLATVSAFTEGPLIKEKMSFLVSARRSWIDLFTGMWGKDDKFDFSLHDLNLKMNYQINRNNRLYLSGYTGADSFTDSFSSQKQDKLLSWGSSFISFRWNHLFNERLFMNTTVYSSRFNNKMTGEDSQDNFQKDYSGQLKYNINEYGLHSDIDLYCDNLYIRTGAKLTFNNYDSDQYHQKKAFQGTAYMENRITLSERIMLNAGINYNFYKTHDADFHLFDPRAQLSYTIKNNISLFVGFSQMNQFFHQISIDGISSPYEIRMPSSLKVKPELAKLYEVGFHIGSPKDNHSFSGSLYITNQERILTYRPAQDLFNDFLAPDPINRLLSGNLRGKGVELNYNGRHKCFDWKLSGSLSEVEEKFNELNNGQYYISPNHAKFIAHLLFNWNINSRNALTATTMFNTGKHISVPSYVVLSTDSYNPGIVDTNESRTEYWSDNLSNYRLPNNYQFNLGYTYRRNYSPKKELLFQIGIYNLFGKPAPFQINVEKSDNGMLLQQTAIPNCIPYVKFGFKI